MMVIGIAAAVIAVTLVILAIFMIPAIVEIRKTAVELRVLARRLDTEMRPVTQELRETLSCVRLLTESAAEKAERMDSFIETVGETGRNLKKINIFMGAIAGSFTTSSLWVTGAKVATKTLIERFSSKKGG